MDFLVREAIVSDLDGLLKLYTQLHNNPYPEIDKIISSLWHEMIDDPKYHIILGCKGDVIVSSCIVVIIPNLTHFQRPYALIENVITDLSYRNKGYGTAVLNYAKSIAKLAGCYKIMLMTGSKNESTLNFYRKAGYNSEDKTAFIMWL